MLWSVRFFPADDRLTYNMRGLDGIIYIFDSYTSYIVYKAIDFACLQLADASIRIN